MFSVFERGQGKEEQDLAFYGIYYNLIMSASDPTATEKVEPSTHPSDTTSGLSSSSQAPIDISAGKPIILHLGDDIRWNQDLYVELSRRFEVKRTYSIGREEFKKALKEKRWGDFVGMYSTYARVAKFVPLFCFDCIFTFMIDSRG